MVEFVQDFRGGWEVWVGKRRFGKILKHCGFLVDITEILIVGAEDLGKIAAKAKEVCSKAEIRG